MLPNKRLAKIWIYAGQNKYAEIFAVHALSDYNGCSFLVILVRDQWYGCWEIIESDSDSEETAAQDFVPIMAPNLFSYLACEYRSVMPNTSPWRSYSKGVLARDFWLSVFFVKGSPEGLDSWAKAVLNLDLDSQRNSIRFDAENRLRAIFNNG
jgi:hypothetical protein